MGSSWPALYRDLLNRDGDRIDREQRFLERLIYIPSRIHRRIRSVAPTDARRALFHLAALPGLAAQLVGLRRTGALAMRALMRLRSEF